MKKWLLNHPANFFLIAAGIAILALWLLDIIDNNFSWHDILVEAHGMFYDLLVFGILLALYEQFKNKKDTIKRYKEELNDYRGWTEGEAAYRVAGIIRRLKKEGQKEINYSNLHLGELETNLVVELIRKKTPIASLVNADLREANLIEVNLFNAKLQYANLSKANLSRAYLERANLSGANLQDANFQNAELQEANLQGANLRDVNLQYAALMHINLQGCIMHNAKLKGSDLNSANLEGAFLYSADLREALLYYANLKEANLEGAFLQGTCFLKTDLKNANLTNASLENAQVDSINWFDILKISNVEGHELLKSKYYVDPTPQENDHYEIYFTIRERKK